MCKKQPLKQPVISKKEVDGEVNALFSALCSDLGQPFEAGSRNVRSIVRSWCPLKYDFSFVEPRDFACSYIPAHFYDRYFFAAELDSNKTLEADAWMKFQDNVLRGALFNVELSNTQDQWLLSVLGEAALLCQRILGELSVEEVFGECGHGPNATSTVKKDMSYLDIKSLDFGGTDAAIETFFEHYLVWNSSLRDELAKFLPLPETGNGVTVVRGDKLSFVPKKFDSLRSMSVQPTLNLFFQLGTGRVIQDRLKRFANIDIESQTDCHMKMAQLASLYPEIGDATLDWRQASDRIWVTICEKIMPKDWFEWCCLIRTDSTEYNTGDLSHTVPLPMIGTMGNGFTFPLQTLVFYCLLRGLARVCRTREIGISVYGDDCIVPVELVPHVSALAEKLGWNINEDKSFSIGGFRESCGMDSYRGMPVRPFRIERPADTKNKNSLKAWAYVCYNGIQEAIAPLQLSGRSVYAWLVKFHEKWDLGAILVVPPRYSDGSGVRLADPNDVPCEALPVVIDKHGGCNFRFLRNEPGDRDVRLEFPFYLLRLAGHSLPLDFKSVLDEGSSPMLSARFDKAGEFVTARCALKRTRYQSVKGYVHTWAYSDDLRY